MCLGNICRSPLAEGVFVDLALKRGVRDMFVVDSCGTGDWHVGSLADPRARQTAVRNGVDLTHRARQFNTDDLERFDLLLAMDCANLRALQKAGASPRHARLLREFDPAAPSGALCGDPPEVPDPYFGGDEGFDDVFAMLTAACSGLLDALLTPDHPLFREQLER